jgi:hypothetical protein
MAKRGPGRPKSAGAADDTVGILNGEVPPRSNVTPSPRKRGRETGDDGLPTTKRRATVKPAEEVPERRKSTRLSHPRASSQQQQQQGRSSDAGQKQSHNLYEVPHTSPPKSSRVTAAKERAGTVKPVRDEDNSASEAEEGEDGAANPLMTSPASNTQNYVTKRGRAGQVKDGEDPVVDVQPVKRGHRLQRLLTKRTKTRSNALLKLQPVQSRTTQKSSARQTVPEEEATLTAGIAEQEDVTEGDQDSTNEEPQEHQDRTPPAEEPVNAVENRPVDGQNGETAQLPGTEEGSERSFNLYECKESWNMMLKAVRENLDEDDGENQAVEIQELVGLIKDARLAYRAVRRGYEGNLEDMEFEIGEHLGYIDERIRKIRATNNRKRDARLIREIYLRGIPKMVKLLKVVLVSRSLNGELSVASLMELNKIIDSTLNLCEKAYRWHPRPALEIGVKRRTGRVIKISLEALRRAYTEAQNDSTDEEEVEARKIAKRQVIAGQVADILAQEQEKRRCAEHNKRKIYRDRHRRSINRVGLVTDVFDIDDLGLNAASPDLAPNCTRRSLPWRETGVAAARQSLPSNSSRRPAARDVARRSRERTEDIPGPMAPDWSFEEDNVLLYGLELFTDANRYLEIDQMYGSAGGPLSGRDVDALMQRAKFYKQTMASQIEEEREEVGNVDRWAYLLSVEG